MDFDELLPLIVLHGDSYRPLKNVIFYSTLAHRVRKSKIMIASEEMDLRIPIMNVLHSGYGKRLLKDFIKENTPSEPARAETYSEPTSLHSEQLVGKTLTPNQSLTKSYEVVQGYLASTFVVIDEAIQLLVDPRFEEARKYLRIALDPIGRNILKKRLTAIPAQHAVEYSPDCSMALFLQPVGWKRSDKFPRDLLSEGLLRRFLVLYPDISEEERLEGFRQSRKPVDDKEAQKDWGMAIVNIDSIAVDQSVDWDLSSVVDLLFDGADRLIKIGCSRGGQCKEFALMAFYDVLKHLSRMSCVQAGVEGRKGVESRDVDVAFGDLSEMWELQLNFVAEMIKSSGRDDRENQQDVEALRVLVDAGCVDETSSQMRVKEFQGIIGDIHGNRYRRLKELGLVEGKQVGSHDSRVWLTPRGTVIVREES